MRDAAAPVLLVAVVDVVDDVIDDVAGDVVYADGVPLDRLVDVVEGAGDKVEESGTDGAAVVAAVVVVTGGGDGVGFGDAVTAGVLVALGDAVGFLGVANPLR